MPSLLPQSPVFNPLHLYPWPYSLACCLLMCLYGAGEQFLVHSSSLQTWIANGVWKKLGSRLWTGNVEIQSFILWLYARERVVHVSICLLMGSLVQAPRVLPHRAGRIPSVWSLLVPGVVLGRTMICRNALVCKWGGLGWANSHILSGRLPTSFPTLRVLVSLPGFLCSSAVEFLAERTGLLGQDKLFSALG